jgi:hypothetical protein
MDDTRVGVFDNAAAVRANVHVAVLVVVVLFDHENDLLSLMFAADSAGTTPGTSFRVAPPIPFSAAAF